MKTIEEKMLEANKARTEILADNPEINSNWTPDAIEIMQSKHKQKSRSDTEWDILDGNLNGPENIGKETEDY